MSNDTSEKNSKVLDEGVQTYIDKVESKADELHELFEIINNGMVCLVPEHSHAREMALAKTKLEEAVMWAVKGLLK